MSEKLLWKYLKAGMGSKWHWQRHEDKAANGIPDVSYGAEKVCGWIELKYLKKMPKIVRLANLTQQQKFWLMERGAFGGHTFILLRIANSYYLFSYKAAETLRIGIGAEYLETVAMHYWHGNINFEELYTCLTQKI